ncbi:hypothetical protein ACFX15_034403 [Malus domestica]
MMKLEGEIPNFFMVWILVVASLSYFHTVGKLTSPGTTKLLAILPVAFFFFYLPLNLTTIFLGGLSSFFLAWLANFKLGISPSNVIIDVNISVNRKGRR